MKAIPNFYHRSKDVVYKDDAVKYSDELARTVAVMYSEDIFIGSVIQTIDDAIETAKEFIEEYPIDTDWEAFREENDMDWDECIIKFVNK